MLKLYNTMSRTKEVFVPRHSDKTVRMFSCGPSIYRRPHLGNYRSFVWEDILQRYLEYSGFPVKRVLNFTDIEDKAIEEAQDEGLTLSELTSPVVEQFHEDARRLRIQLPNTIPRSSTSVDQAVTLIQTLLEKGFAYWYKGNVFFDPLQSPGFGRLSRLDMSRWPKEKRRFKKDTYRGRRWNLGDFILWHGFREGEKVFWDTDIGRGRPSWNIQDPAMVTKHLGYAVDLCCGGIDNLYRHHDYNIAVIEAVSGEEFAPYWVHGEHLLVKGRKMSKSLGNIVYPSDLMGEGVSGQHVRFYLCYGHHGKRLNFTSTSFHKATSVLDRMREAYRQLTDIVPGPKTSMGGEETSSEATVKLRRRFEERMNDDLDVRGAVDALEDELSTLIRLDRSRRLSVEQLQEILRDLERIDTVLQVILPE